MTPTRNYFSPSKILRIMYAKHVHMCTVEFLSPIIYRFVIIIHTVKSRPVDSILNSFGQRSHYISIKFPLHKQSENSKMSYLPRQATTYDFTVVAIKIFKMELITVKLFSCGFLFFVVYAVCYSKSVLALDGCGSGRWWRCGDKCL